MQRVLAGRADLIGVYPHPSSARLSRLRAERGAMVDALGALVSVESPSADPSALRACARVLDDLAGAVLGSSASWSGGDGPPVLSWRFGTEPGVLLLGHLDTVWPVGTVGERPFDVVDGRAVGPGVFDMKAGLVQALFALATLDRLDGVHLLVTSDEEVGSPSSREAVEAAARQATAALVLEPSARGALKVARKGVATYTLTVSGRAAHAGLEPEAGVNALVELAHQAVRIDRLADGLAGASVTPTVASAGTAVNVVPAEACLRVDVRTADPIDQARIDAALRALEPVLPGAALAVHGGAHRPPMPAAASAGLFARAQAAAARIGLPALEGVAVGGGSDGNLTAGVGTPTLDGLGAVGDGAHAEEEHVDVAAMPERAALLAELVHDLVGEASR